MAINPDTVLTPVEDPEFDRPPGKVLSKTVVAKIIAKMATLDPLERDAKVTWLKRQGFSVTRGLEDQMLSAGGTPGMETYPPEWPSGQTAIDSVAPLEATMASSFLQGATRSASFGLYESPVLTEKEPGPQPLVEVPLLGDVNIAEAAGDIAGGFANPLGRAYRITTTLGKLGSKAVSWLARHPKMAEVFGELVETGTEIGALAYAKFEAGEELSLEELAIIAVFSQTGRAVGAFKGAYKSTWKGPVTSKTGIEFRNLKNRPDLQKLIREADALDRDAWIDAQRKAATDLGAQEIRSTRQITGRVPGVGSEGVPIKPPFFESPDAPKAAELHQFRAAAAEKTLDAQREARKKGTVPRKRKRAKEAEKKKAVAKKPAKKAVAKKAKKSPAKKAGTTLAIEVKMKPKKAKKPAKKAVAKKPAKKPVDNAATRELEKKIKSSESTLKYLKDSGGHPSEIENKRMLIEILKFELDTARRAGGK